MAMPTGTSAAWRGTPAELDGAHAIRPDTQMDLLTQSLTRLAGADSDGGVLHVVIKADVQGSAEALADALSVLSTEHASVSVLRAGVGLVAPGDISLANTTSPPAVVFGFGVKPDKGVENMARREGKPTRCRRLLCPSDRC